MKKYKHTTECPHCGHAQARIYYAGIDMLTPRPGEAVVTDGTFICRRCKRTYSCWLTIFENKEMRNHG